MEFDISSNEPSLLHRVLNFNEALFTLARGDEWMSFSLDQIDKTSGQRIDAKSARRLRRVLAKIEVLIAEHDLEEIVRLTVIIPPSRPPQELGLCPHLTKLLLLLAVGDRHGSPRIELLIYLESHQSHQPNGRRPADSHRSGLY